MAKELAANEKELEILKALHGTLSRAQREFTIAFTTFCAQRDLAGVSFVGFTASGVLVEEPNVG